MNWKVNKPSNSMITSKCKYLPLFRVLDLNTLYGSINWRSGLTTYPPLIYRFYYVFSLLLLLFLSLFIFYFIFEYTYILSLFKNKENPLYYFFFNISLNLILFFYYKTHKCNNKHTQINSPTNTHGFLAIFQTD